MYTLKTILSGFCLLYSVVLFAQKKDALEALPNSNKIEVSNHSLEALFHSSQNISVDLAPGFRIEGKIENKSNHGDNITSILIQLQNNYGGILSISRYIDANGIVYYAGRLLKLREPEGMMLVEKDKHYYFIQTQQRFLVTE